MAKKFLGAAAALALPCAAFAQNAAEPAPAAAAPVATPAPTPAPSPAPVVKKEDPKPIVTPYGFVLLDAFFNGGGFNNKDNTWQALRGSNGGSFLGSARGSRFGVKLALKDDNWTKADLSGVIEFDFKAGFVPTLALSTTTTQVTQNGASTTVVTGVSGSLPANSATWYNAVARMRLASLSATWKGDLGSVQVLAGQDWGLVNTLNAETIAWSADPVFTEAGNIWRRSPQIRVTYGLDAGMINALVAAAILSPADSSTPVDNGVGNISRQPDLEARGQVAVKVDKDLNATVGFGYHSGTKRFNNATADQRDTTVRLWGLDADLNLTQYLQLKGEYFASNGAEDSYTGMLRNGVIPAASLVSKSNDYKPLATAGFWAQAILKPLPQVWLTGGYGQERVNDPNDLYGFASFDDKATRTKNAQYAFGVLVNAGKYWRFGVEYGHTKSTYADGYVAQAQQTAVSTMLKF